MKIFWTKASYERHLHEQIIASRGPWMDAVASNAAKDALHYYICFRTLEWWREAIDKAEKQGNKYVSLAQLFTEIQKENEKI